MPIRWAAGGGILSSRSLAFWAAAAAARAALSAASAALCARCAAVIADAASAFAESAVACACSTDSFVAQPLNSSPAPSKTANGAVVKKPRISSFLPECDLKERSFPLGHVPLIYCCEPEYSTFPHVKIITYQGDSLAMAHGETSPKRAAGKKVPSMFALNLGRKDRPREATRTIRNCSTKACR